jgi:beta-mannosidase
VNRKEQLSSSWTLVFPEKVRNQHDLPLQLVATVPGSVHEDLIAAGLIADISINGKESDQEWIRNSDTTFITTFESSQTNGNVLLTFNGIDTIAKIFVNDALRLETKNMHRTYEIDITKDYQSGTVEIRVEFTAPMPHALHIEQTLGAFPNPYNLPYNFQRKMACSYGWDWGPVTITSGIWKPISLTFWENARIQRVGLSGYVNKTPRLMGSVNVVGDATVGITVRDGENILTQQRMNLTEAQTFDIEVSSAELWWPRNRGEQKLYDVDVELFHNDELIEVQTRKVGFRSVEIDTSEINGKHLFAIKVNGERLWIRGANWIPDDPFPARITRERYAERINDMLEAGITGIRVWGGGIYEAEDFYNLCDEAGIVVWQDFLFACAAYPETDEMFDEVHREVIDAVSRLQSHPSLVIWCGGNECIEGYHYWGWQEPLAGKPWGSTFYFDTIPKVLAVLDPQRPYIPGSPFSTHSDDVKNFDSGTNHIWDVWNELGYERYEEYSPAFAAEFGFNGPGSWPMLTRAIGKPTLDSKDPDLAIHQKAFDGMEKIEKGLHREWVNPPTQGPEWYFAAQLLQARAVQTGLKHFRSLYERCSGTILWQFNDMWPAISWAVLDFTGHRKLAWFAMQEAYRPRAVVLTRPDFDMPLTLINDTHEAWNTSGHAYLIDQDGYVIEEVTFPVNIEGYSVERYSIPQLLSKFNQDEVLNFVVVDVDGIRAARRTSMTPATGVLPEDYEIVTSLQNGNVVVEVTANRFLHELCLLPELIQEGARVDQQLRAVLPGEKVTFAITRVTNAEGLQKNIRDIVWSHNRLLT